MKKKIPMWLVVVLIILVGAGISFGVYKYIENRTKENKVEKTETKNVVKEEALSLEDNTVQSLLNIVHYDQKGSVFDTRNIFLNNDNLTVDKISNNDKFQIVFDTFLKGSNDDTITKVEVSCNGANGGKKLNDLEDYCTDESEYANGLYQITIDGPTYDKMLKKAFGTNVKYEKTTCDTSKGTNSGCIEIRFGVVDMFAWMSYNSNSKKYEGYTYEGGTGSLDNILRKTISATKKGDEIKIVDKFVKLVYDTENDKYEIYSSFKFDDDGVKADSPIAEFSDKENAKNAKIDNYLDQAATVTYTFKKDTNGNYYFSSSNIK